MNTYIQQKLEEFDKWRNDGEHATWSDEDGYIEYLDIVMVKDFMARAYQEQHTQLVQEFVEDIRSSAEDLPEINASNESLVLRIVLKKLLELRWKYSSLLPNNKEEQQ